MIATLVSDEDWWVTRKRIDVRKGVKEHQRYRITHQEDVLMCGLLDNVGAKMTVKVWQRIQVGAITLTTVLLWHQ